MLRSLFKLEAIILLKFIAGATGAGAYSNITGTGTGTGLGSGAIVFYGDNCCVR